MCGMKRELTGPKVQLVLKEQNMKMRDFNFFKESLFLQERFWEAVLKVCMIYLITADIQIPFLYAEKYNLFPSLEDWRGKILLLETSEEQPDPKHYRKMVETFKKGGSL